MKSDAIAFGIAGVVFGLIAGWIIGSQQAGLREAAPAPVAAASAPATATTASGRIEGHGVQDHRRARAQ